MRSIRLIVPLFLVVWALFACSAPSDEQRLREILAAMEAAAEGGEIGNFMGYVAEDFAGASSGISRADLQRMVLVQLRRNARVQAVVSNIEVTLYADRATLSCTALLTGGARGWLPERGKIFSIETGWRRADNDWKLIQASWDPNQ